MDPESRPRHASAVLCKADLVEVPEEVLVEAKILEEPLLEGARRAERARTVEPVKEGFFRQRDQAARPIRQLLSCPAEAVGSERHMAVAEASEGRLEVAVPFGCSRGNNVYAFGD